MNRPVTVMLSFLLIITSLVSCKTFNPDDTRGGGSDDFPSYIQRETAPVSALRDGDGPGKLRLHAKSGEMVELTGWRFDSARQEVRGTGTEYDRDRRIIRGITREGPLSVGRFAQIQWDVLRKREFTRVGAVGFGLLALEVVALFIALALMETSGFGGHIMF